MTGLIWLLLLLGGCLSLFAGAEWYLSRREEEGTDHRPRSRREEEGTDHRPRSRRFGVAAALVLLVAAGLLVHGRSLHLTRAAHLAALEAETGLTAAIRPVLEGTVPGDPGAIYRARAAVFAARQKLSVRMAERSPLQAVILQADTALGVAYATLTQEWLLAVAGRGQEGPPQADRTAHLSSEWARLEAERTCYVATGQPCAPPPALDPDLERLRSLMGRNHRYLIELQRFSEPDFRLVDTSAREAERVRQLLKQARALLAREERPAGSAAVYQALDRLFQAGEEALVREQAAVLQGRWGQQAMAAIAEPVYAAQMNLLVTLVCARDGLAECQQ